MHRLIIDLVDDRTAGLVLRALRHRRGLRQSDVAERAGCSQAMVSRVEAGHAAGSTLETLRRIFGAVDARVQLTPGWRGADLDRLLDLHHARLVASVADRLEGAGWTVSLEVTYSEYGERGSIDILATRADRRAALVVEAKTDLPSVEATGRKVDEKARLAPAIVARTVGWRPDAVGRLVALPDTTRLRRLISSPPGLRRMFPAEATAIRRWLSEPVGPIAGLLFLPDITPMHRCLRRRPARGSQGRVTGAPGRNPAAPSRAPCEAPAAVGRARRFRAGGDA